MEKLVEIRGVVKKYDKIILDNLNFAVRRRDLISIIGPNGCGKTTLMNIIAGLDQPNSGIVKKSNNLKIGFVFQNCKESLLPWRDIYTNIQLPLEITSCKDDICQPRINALLKAFDLTEHRHKFPHQLSGGLIQLTAIARALASNPDLLILDEPFKSLAFDTARRTMELVIAYCESKKMSAILISHDIDQAILFADKIIVLSHPPTSIRQVVNVDISRPRRLAHCRQCSFFATKNRVLEEFENEHN
jgi:NitT/TauT family transport system ATP-binding protein